MRDFEELLVAIYVNTIEADKLFVGHDVLMKRLSIDKQTFLRLLRLLSRRGFLDTGVVGMERLSEAGIEYVENNLV